MRTICAHKILARRIPTTAATAAENRTFECTRCDRIRLYPGAIESVSTSAAVVLTKNEEFDDEYRASLESIPSKLRAHDGSAGHGGAADLCGHGAHQGARKPRRIPGRPERAAGAHGNSRQTR